MASCALTRAKPPESASALGQRDPQTVSSQNFRNALREPVGEKTPIKTDDGPCLGPGDRVRVPVVGGGPAATRSTFVKVKSSAMTARQPSVPNLICPMFNSGVALVRSRVSAFFSRPLPNALTRARTRCQPHGAFNSGNLKAA